MKLSTKKPSYGFDLDGNGLITFAVSRNDLITLLKDLEEKKDKLTIEVKEYRKGRSLNANGYFWKLCGDLSKKLSNQVATSSVEIYRNYITQLNVYRDVEICDSAVDTLIHSWGLNGLGWIAEKIDTGGHEGFSIVRLYYGSSTFNTRQMSRLIDMVVTDCKEQGIEVMTPNELSLLKERWGDEKHNTE